MILEDLFLAPSFLPVHYLPTNISTHPQWSFTCPIDRWTDGSLQKAMLLGPVLFPSSLQAVAKISSTSKCLIT